MLKKKKYRFNRSKRKEFTRGYRLDYLSEQVGISYSYFTQILRGAFDVDDTNREYIMEKCGYSTKEIKQFKNYYFEEV